MSFAQIEMQVIQWAEARRIIPNSTSLAQAIKTHEELGELLSALHRGDKNEIEDAYADILITLIIGADLAGMDLVTCLERGYNVIKDRTGHLRTDGVFVKD